MMKSNTLPRFILLFISFTLFLSSCSTSPEPEINQFSESSNIELSSSVETVGDLYRLGLVWGFVKYFHPAVAKGGYDMDVELFKLLPHYIEAATPSKKDSIVLNWINSLGKFSIASTVYPDSSKIKMYPDLAWIENSGFSSELVAKLMQVKDAKRTKKHHYIKQARGVGNPVFVNEDPYKSMTYPDDGYRLLSLFRYWNMVQYFYPYLYLVDGDWKESLKEFIPVMIDAGDATEYRLGLLRLIGKVRDTHASIYGDNILAEYFGKYYSAARVYFVGDKVYVTDFYDEEKGAATGLKIGDEIIKVNGETIAEILDRELPITPASNYVTQLRNLSFHILRSKDSTAVINYKRAGKLFSTTIELYPLEYLPDYYYYYKDADTSFRMITDDIALIDNGKLKRDELPAIWEKVKATKGLILDLRNYPSDFPLFSLCGILFPSSEPFVMFSSISPSQPGLSSFMTTISAGMKKEDSYKGKVVILVNEVSQSSAEYHAMAYRQYPGAVVIGSTTAGADGNVSEIYLPGNVYTMISGIGVYYPDGGETQQIGILPDIEIHPTIEGIIEGRDELLEKGLEIIND